MGVYLGAHQNFYQPNENHLDGEHELRQLQDLNLRGYSIFGTNYYQAESIPSDWKSIPGTKAFSEEVRVQLNNNFAGKTNWALKEPGMTGLIPIYRDVLEGEKTQPRFAIFVRHPLDVARAQIEHETQWGLNCDGDQIRGLKPPVGEHAIGIWLHYTLCALRDTKGCAREVFLYEDFTNQPDKEVRRLAQTLTEAPSEQQTEDAIASTRLRTKEQAGDLAILPPLVERTYKCAQQASRDSNALNEGKFDQEIEELWNELTLMGRMVRPIQLPSGQFMFSWMQGNKPGFQGVKYSPTGAWQTLKIPVEAPAGSMTQIDPYQMPCQIWIKRAVWKGATETRAHLQPGPNGVLQDLYGITRLTVFGPGPIITQIPSGAKEFEIEFQVRSSHNVMNDIVGLLRGGIEQARRGGMRH